MYRYWRTILILSISLFNIYDASAFVSDFASVKTEEVKVRSGPGKSYPIKFVYRKKGLPVKLLKEYDNWYQIQDLEGDIGWIAKSFINVNFKTVIAIRDDVIYNRANPKSKPIFRVEKNVIMSNLGCRNDFCRISVSNKKGWINKKSVWGCW